MGVVPPSCEPGSPQNPICVSDCGVPLHVIVDNDIQVEIPNPLPVEVQGTVCVSDCGTPIQVEVTNPLEIPQPLNVCQDESCTPWLVEVTNPLVIDEPLSVCLDESCSPIHVIVDNQLEIDEPLSVCIDPSCSPVDVSVVGDVTIAEPVTIEGNVCFTEGCVLDVVVTEPVEIVGPVNVCQDESCDPWNVEIANDVGNPIPVTGTVCIDDCGTPIEVEGVVSVGCGPETTATVTRVGVTSGASTTLLAANTNRKAVIIQAEGNNNAYVKFGSGASSTDYTVQLTSSQLYEHEGYTGEITARGNSGSTKYLQVTEIECV